MPYCLKSNLNGNGFLFDKLYMSILFTTRIFVRKMLTQIGSKKKKKKKKKKKIWFESLPLLDYGGFSADFKILYKFQFQFYVKPIYF